VSRQPLDSLAAAVCAGVAVTALVSAAHAAGGFLAAARGSDWADLLGAVNVIRGITFIATVAVLVAWLYRARVNLASMPHTRPRWAPNWAIGALAVPLVGPGVFAAMLAEVARQSLRPAVAAGQRLTVMVWAWLVAASSSAVLFVTAEGAPDAAAIVVRAGAEGFQLVAAVLLIEVVRAVTWWQDGTRPLPWVPAPRQPARRR
jgi:hypothetical protein